LKYKAQADITITTVDVTVVCTQATTLYFDAIVLNYRLKPCVILNYDNGEDANIYGKIFPLVKSYGFTGSFQIGGAAYPGSAANVITYAHLMEMLAAGWECDLYGGNGTTPSDIESWSLEADWYNYIKSAIDLQAAHGQFCPVCYHCPSGLSSNVLIKVLKANGIKMCRIGNSKRSITHFDAETFEVQGAQLLDDGNGQSYKELTSVMAQVDECIDLGNIMPLFIHQMLDTNDIITLNTSTSTYTAFLEYIKLKSDAGLLDVINFRGLYSRFYPEDSSKYDYMRITKRLAYANA
jgi:hypothetical protein